MNKDAVFFNISKFSFKDTQGTALPKEFTDQYIAKWIKVSFPQGFLKELATQLPFQNNSTQTPEQLELKKLVEDTNFLKDVVFVAMEDVKGTQSQHFNALVDQDRLYEFMLKLAEIQGRNLADDEKKTLKDDLKKYDVRLNLWVAKDSALLNRFEVLLKFKGSDAEPQGQVSVMMTFFDFSKPVTVEVPKDAMELPLGDSLPLPGLSMGIESEATLPPSLLNDMSQEIGTQSTDTTTSSLPVKK